MSGTWFPEEQLKHLRTRNPKELRWLKWIQTCQQSKKKESHDSHRWKRVADCVKCQDFLSLDGVWPGKHFLGRFCLNPAVTVLLESMWIHWGCFRNLLVLKMEWGGVNYVKSLMVFRCFQEGIQMLPLHLFSAQCNVETPVWLKKIARKNWIKTVSPFLGRKSLENDPEFSALKSLGCFIWTLCLCFFSGNKKKLKRVDNERKANSHFPAGVLALHFKTTPSARFPSGIVIFFVLFWENRALMMVIALCRLCVLNTLHAEKKTPTEN